MFINEVTLVIKMLCIILFIIM